MYVEEKVEICCVELDAPLYGSTDEQIRRSIERAFGVPVGTCDPK